MELRPGTETDMDAAAAIWQRAHAKRLGYVPESAKKDRAKRFLNSRLVRPDAKFLIAEEAGEILGMLLASQARELDGLGEKIPGVWHISYVAVDPRRWGAGVGGSLLARIAADAIDCGQWRLQLWVVQDNARAKALYERFGFVFSGRRRLDEYGEPIMHYTCELDCKI